MFEKVEDFFCCIESYHCVHQSYYGIQIYLPSFIQIIWHIKTRPLCGIQSFFLALNTDGRTERTFFVVIQRNVQFAFVRVRRECVCMCACAGIWSISKS